MIQPKISRKFRNFEAKILKMFVGIDYLSNSNLANKSRLKKVEIIWK